MKLTHWMQRKPSEAALGLQASVLCHPQGLSHSGILSRWWKLHWVGKELIASLLPAPWLTLSLSLWSSFAMTTVMACFHFLGVLQDTGAWECQCSSSAHKTGHFTYPWKHEVPVIHFWACALSKRTLSSHGDSSEAVCLPFFLTVNGHPPCVSVSFTS